METIGSLWMWIGFTIIGLVMLAILGLRAMYFLLADMADRFSLLKYGLALVLMFVGVKMLLIDVVKIPVLMSLGLVFSIIAASVVLSLRRNSAQLKAAELASPAKQLPEK